MMTIRPTEDGWQLDCPEQQRDFHIRWEQNGNPDEPYVLDVFDSRLPTGPGRAHVGSTSHPNLDAAIKAAFEHIT